MAFYEQYQLGARQRVCSVTGKPFVDGEWIWTSLFRPSGSHAFLRKDYGEEGWENRPIEDHSPFSYWKSQYKAPAKRERQPELDAETQWLVRLTDEDDEKTVSLRYVLALVLERRRLLKEIDVQSTPDGLFRVYQHRKTQDVFVIHDPECTLDDLRQLQTEVIQFLEAIIKSD